MDVWMGEVTNRVLRRLRMRHLELLQLLGEFGTVSEAAERLNLSQSAVSKMLAEMERAFDTPLFTRSKRGVEPTQQGRAVIQGAGVLVNDLLSIEERLVALAHGATDILRVGAFSTVSLMAYGLTEFHRRHPGMTTRVREALPHELVDALLRAELDCIVGALPADMLTPAQIDALSFTALAHDHVCVMVVPGHPLLRKKKLTWAQLHDQRWIMPAHGTLIRSALVNVFLGANLRPPHPEIESTSPVTMRWLIKADPQRLGVMRWQQAREEIREGYLCQLPLAQYPPLAPVSLIARRRETARRPLLDGLAKALLDEAARMGV
jgi:DNA-binding transcriptional LysR family regulator